ncbi:GNAT family N-acetyltransferase [Tateyamaria pelophila]|uniref:hypothetical protein n=1 Tax=Tateyamaria pelophila TaxID=328415 RepID=UPI001CBEE908|nr:hypothetical protein [Tateyamaria pelophila]
MTVSIRPANPCDLEHLAELFLEDAKVRHAQDPVLWALERGPRKKIVSTLKAAMEADAPVMRQIWLIAEADGVVVGVAHSILLPVPPIYAGVFGPPGLIMEDCYVAPGAPPDTYVLLLNAAEADLIAAGARILLGSSVEGGAWAAHYLGHGYEPLTCYFAKSGLAQTVMPDSVRNAEPEDVAGIVASSAVNRQILWDLHRVFWEPHHEADKRFASWMQRSLTLTDRDMFVSGMDGEVQGYAISQPATPLHFPTPHDISAVGVIDDFYHDALEAVDQLGATAGQAVALFEAAETARAQRDNAALLVVCPAAWTSKIELLTAAGYSNAVTWFYKYVAAST